MNYIALVVASLVSFLFGWLWYSPMLFGKMYMKMKGKTEADMKKGMEKGMGWGMTVEFIGTLLMVYVLAYFMMMLKVMDMSGVWMLAFWIWLGFKLPGSLSQIAWEKKPWTIIALEAYSLIAMGIAGSVLVWMK